MIKVEIDLGDSFYQFGGSPSRSRGVETKVRGTETRDIPTKKR